MVTTDASPYLVNLPAGPSGTVARRVYRQFLSEAQNGVMGHVIKPDANGNSIPNNTYPSFRRRHLVNAARSEQQGKSDLRFLC